MPAVPSRPRPKSPRIPPLTESSASSEQQQLMEGLKRKGKVWNVFATFCQHTLLAKYWLPFATYVLRDNTVPPREREILILRIGWLCQSEYEWAQHVRIGKRAGLTDDEIRGISEGAESVRLNAADRLLVRATDELHQDACVSDATWQALSEIYNQSQMVDLVFTVGQYNLVSMALNSFGVQLDDDLEGFEKTLSS
jgi:4-carboxymuconolactone decarboxylase